MAEILHELQQFNSNDWVWLILVMLAFFASIACVVFVIVKQLRQVRLSVGKDGVKLNADANGKLDIIIDKLQKLERDVVALQIMNEQLTVPERLKLYDYYKKELKGNSFIDEYVKVIKEDMDTSRFS